MKIFYWYCIYNLTKSTRPRFRLTRQLTRQPPLRGGRRELELELIQSHMTQKSMLRGEVDPRALRAPLAATISSIINFREYRALCITFYVFMFLIGIVYLIWRIDQRITQLKEVALSRWARAML